jgi:DNA gyrase subunit A
MAIRFPESDVRPTGRDTSGVRGIKLGSGDQLVGMVIAEPDATLLTVCEHGYGKRTPFGPGDDLDVSEESSEADTDVVDDGNAAADAEGDSSSSGMRYRTQHRGGKGVRDIKTTKRNGSVVSIVTVRDDDQVFLMTGLGKIQRVNVREINSIGRNTQGVRIMRMDDGDTIAAAVHVPPGEQDEEEPSESLPG